MEKSHFVLVISTCTVVLIKRIKSTEKLFLNLIKLHVITDFCKKFFFRNENAKAKNVKILRKY